MDLTLAALLGLAVGLALGYAVSSRRPASPVAGQAVASLVAPLAQHLDRVEAHLHQLEVGRAEASAELRHHVSTLAAGTAQVGHEARALSEALTKPQARGRWGELHLRRVVELAGMLDRCDFTEQVAFDEGRLRPDLIVHLPGGGSVVVDAKVSLAALLEQRVEDHARHLRQHVDRLADKRYWDQLAQAPDFIVLFLPTESILGNALQTDPTLLEHAMARRVHLATPVTLLSLLRTAAYSWQQHQLADNAQEVFAAGKELFSRLAVFGGHVDKLGRSLTAAVTAFNQTVGSLERTVLPSARRMAELGLDGDLPTPAPVEEVARPVSAPHLIALG